MSQSTSVLGPVVSRHSFTVEANKHDKDDSDSIDRERRQPVQKGWKMKKEKPSVEDANRFDPNWGDLRKLTKPERGFVHEVPPKIRQQTLELAYRYRRDPEITERAKRLLREGKSTNFKLARCLAITDSFNTFQLLRLRYFDFLQAFDDDGRYISLEKFLMKRKSDKVRLITGSLHNPVDKLEPMPVIIKWYESRHRDTRAEVWAYKKLRNLKCRVPWFSSSYMLWKTAVLVIEPLEPISGEDNIFEMMAQITQQLKIVHTIGVHSDIKPGNIMKKRFDSTFFPYERGVDQGDWGFVLIDYGGLATEKIAKFHYWRHTWTKRFAAKDRYDEDQRTHWVYDLLELVYTAKGLQNELIEGKDIRRRRKRGEKKVQHLPVNSGFKDRLLICHNYVMGLMKRPENRNEQAYDEFIKICRAPNPRHTEQVNSSEVISPPLVNQASETLYQEETQEPSSRVNQTSGTTTDSRASRSKNNRQRSAKPAANKGKERDGPNCRKPWGKQFYRSQKTN